MSIGKIVAIHQALGGSGGGDSSGGGVYVVHVTEVQGLGVLDKTWKEIWEAAESNVITLELDSAGADYAARGFYYATVGYAPKNGVRSYYLSWGTRYYRTNSETGYPVEEE